MSIRAQVEIADQLDRILAQIGMLPTALRQGITDELWSKIPAEVDEFATSANQAAGVPLAVSPQYSTLELIGSIVAVVPAGATGTVQLGSMQLGPLPAGVTVLTPVRKYLGPGDIRTLTLAGAAGQCTLWLTGTQAPTFGVIGP